MSRRSGDESVTLLSQAEELLETSPGAAAPQLEALAVRGRPSEVRVQALALLAMIEAGAGSDSGMRTAERRLANAATIKTSSRIAAARLAHGRGYLAYKRGERAVVLEQLNRAAADYPQADRRRAHVFDTLGMFFQNTGGDLDRARAYFLLSLGLKEAARDSFGIALTCGNLGRLEIARERYAEAERWLRRDLAEISKLNPRPSVEAGVRNHLAIALIGQGNGRLTEAAAELQRAQEIVPRDSAAHAYALKDMARLEVLRGQVDQAERCIGEARAIAERQGYRETLVTIRFVEAMIWARRTQSVTDDAFVQATAALDESRSGFDRLAMPREVCEVDILHADLLARVGKAGDAAARLAERTLPVAERTLFGQLQPIARIEARLLELDPVALTHLRTRRMLGGIPSDEFTGRLRGERRRLTVWTCDLRGFTLFCEETGDAILVVEMLNRFFAALGRLILDHGGRIDKYVGDNILAHFREAKVAAGVALAALGAVEQINTERKHLADRELQIGIGLATGEVVEGNVGFAGKLEHTIIGRPVNLACRLVGEALPGQILVDGDTREALGKQFAFASPGRKITPKGISNAKVFVLKGRRERRR